MKSPAKSGKTERGWVIGIGASAGGLEALSLFVANVPGDFPGTIIVAQHLAPHAKSMMVELIAKNSTLPVEAAEHEKDLEPGHIYIVPPNFDIDIVKNRVILTPAGPETRPKPSVDEFFMSLARTYRERAVGIVLSGTGSDGAQGIKAIHTASGMTMAQDARSAKYDGMPRAAIETSCIDAILSPEQMAKDLSSLLVDHISRYQYSQKDIRGLLGEAVKLIQQKDGTDFSQYKLPTLHRRLAKRIAHHGKTPEEYLNFLKKHPAELTQLGQEFLISVTHFFRDPEVFEALEQALMKTVLRKQPGQEFRVWVAGCATGEEAYSIAMLLLEVLDRTRMSLFVKVFATDIDPDAILEARSGVFSEKEVASVPKAFLEKYFEKRAAGHYEINQRIRDMVVFARQDMIQNPPFVKLDLVSCRNVLIYFDQDLQKKVLETFHYSLLPSGLLVLGKSESLGDRAKFFEPLDRKTKIYERINLVTSVAPPMKLAKNSLPFEIPAVRRRPEVGPSLLVRGMNRLMQAYDISGVVIDKEANILQTFGDVSQFMGFFTSNVEFRLLNLLPKEVAIEIPSLIRKVDQDGGPHKSRRYRLKKDKSNVGYQLVLRALAPPEEAVSGPNLYLVNFETKKVKEAVVVPAGGNGAGQEQELSHRVHELEQELHLTREHLQTVIEELGVANEELQSLNEELSSTNEELNSANEEMETTNEELQSSNEELTTLNEELAVKSGELGELNRGLENIQNSIGSPLIVVDQNMQIVRYNPDALKIFALNPSSIGTDIHRVSTRLELPRFKEIVSETIRSGKVQEVVCENFNSVYQMRAMPYVNEQGKIVGAVLVFFDNTESIRTQEKLAKSELQIQAIINGSDSLICLKDQFGRYLIANKAFKDFFKLSEKQIIGRTDREVFEDETAFQFREADLEVILKRAPLRREEVLVGAKKEARSFVVHRFPLLENTNETPYAIGMVAADVSEQVKVHEDLRASEARYRAIIDDQAVLVCRHLQNGEITFVNSVFVSQFSGANAVAVGKSFYTVVEQRERAAFEKEVRQISFDQPVAQNEHRMVRKDGSVRWVRWYHRGIFDEQGQPLEYQAVGFDVTDYRDQTDRLREQEVVFSGVYANTSDLISIYRAEGSDFVLESLNRPAEKNLRLIYPNPVGKTVREMFPVERATDLESRFRRVLERSTSEAYDEVLHLPDSVRYLSTTLVPLPGFSGERDRVATLSRDVSSYKTIERDLRFAKESAEVANRAKSDFLASMSHELRTPLNVVLGMSHLLQESSLDSEQKGFASSIERSGKMLLSLIEDVLDISKIESGKVKLVMGVFSIPDLLKEVLELFALQAAEKGLTLAHKVAKEAEEYVVGDMTRIRQVLVNLVGNAIKFTDRGQVEIAIQAGAASSVGEKIFSFGVRDSGIGIKAADHQKIFQKFSQVESGHSRRFGGSGLGLVISQQLIHMMRGQIGFESEEGRGSRFWFKVPLTLATREDDKVVANKSQQEVRLAPLKILAVDDNRESQNVVRLFIKRLGHEVFTASSGVEAIEQIKAHDVDLVLMDVQMPEMDGYETTQRIRQGEDGPHLPIIALTANAMAGDIDKCREAGMDDYMSKPLRLDVLKEMLARWGKNIGKEVR